MRQKRLSETAKRVRAQMAATPDRAPDHVSEQAVAPELVSRKSEPCQETEHTWLLGPLFLKSRKIEECLNCGSLRFPAASRGFSLLLAGTPENTAMRKAVAELLAARAAVDEIITAHQGNLAYRYEA